MESSISPKEWYKKRKRHWETKDAILKTMLGGWDSTHLPDIKCSNELVSGGISSKQLKTPLRAGDCCSGIGRVTQFVLLNHFQEIDGMEQDTKFVEKAKEIFQGIKQVKNIYCSPIESFDFKEKYDLIWVQWSGENIEDEDIIKFLDKCRKNLREGGVMIVKENYYYTDEERKEDPGHNKEYEYSVEDGSKQRKDEFYLKIFINNGFKVIKHFFNPNWPTGIMPLTVYVLT